MNLKKYISIATGLALTTSVVLAIPVFAQTANNFGGGRAGGSNGMMGRSPVGANRGAGMMRPGVFGTVTSVNGNIITVNGHTGFGTTTAAVVYSVDATNATMRKNNATSTVSSIVVGDTISVRGTVTGTNVVATSILDGVLSSGGMMRPGNPGQGNRGSNGYMNGKPWTGSSTAQIIGNGQPVVAGTVSEINGTTLTVTTTSNVTYTVDVSNAKVMAGQNATASLSSIVVGNKVLVQGTVNGTSITASTVIDQTKSVTQAPPIGVGMGQPGGMFASIGQFFAHIFGF